ncbi:hypothetical protein [Aggregatibacter kilianii]|uniref:hypothetical protein n=1 Tax=Aggregatibacter kilianii TaxID=2025884 RepID=UPI000D64E715|nr:hypothetical protein [Aggregatibacter kilianii]
MLTQTLPCPHCNQSIKGTAFKGFMGIKSCPHCNKKIKLRKGPVKKTLLAFLLWLVVMIPLLAVYISLVGPEMNIGLISFIIISYMPLLIYSSKQISFEKDE